MIDNFAILLNTIAILVIVLRAAWMDSRLPWFGPIPTGDQQSEAPQSQNATAGASRQPNNIPNWRERRQMQSGRRSREQQG
ncbi:hypothetical protein J8J14_18750 [Roseomonas sp. SSH11]|uniref:Uncharacterized protein n=1 Tax=Pararoseomonas baculiformis TaxID=2820812 RepID=A0ABS4AIH4_9PROT|nr:hypothetical protein [Pararoseomonas baculiformis]MBP0446819.1 hypothetical protein [Pararoseomonas baculiformis]